MSIGLVLTLIFMVLKLTEHIDWSWFYVVLPVLIELGVTGIVLAAIVGWFVWWGKK